MCGTALANGILMEGLVGTKIKGCEKAVVVQETHVQKIRMLVGFLQMVLLT